jgi:hypothetical protein
MGWRNFQVRLSGRQLMGEVLQIRRADPVELVLLSVGALCGPGFERGQRLGDVAPLGRIPAACLVEDRLEIDVRVLRDAREQLLVDPRPFAGDPVSELHQLGGHLERLPRQAPERLDGGSMLIARFTVRHGKPPGSGVGFLMCGEARSLASR